MAAMKTVGVLGGMGPLATVSFLQLLIEHTPATRDWDHLRTIVDIHPHIPSRSRHHLYGEASPVSGMIDACRRLAAYPVDFIVIPCNSAAAFLPEVVPHVTVPIESILEATVAEMARHPARPSRVAALGGVVTYDRALYGPPLAARGLTLVRHDPDLQRQTESLIETLKRAGASQEADHEFEKIERRLIERHEVDGLILGCTELALLKRTQSPLCVVDSAAALARHAVALARGRDVEA